MPQPAAQPNVRVGVGVLVKNPKEPTKIFAGKRKGSHGAGKLALPGGHLDFGETWEECAAREVLEETNLKVHNIKFAHVTNDPMLDENKHYVTIFMMCECVDENAMAENMEPHLCQGWSSYGWDELESMLPSSSCSSGNVAENVVVFGPLKRLIEQAPSVLLDFIGVKK